MWSGDLVSADEEGFLYFVGRNDEMIKTSGYRVSPTEIEEVAYGTGLVRDAVALGVDDPRLGQRIVLVVASRGRRRARPRRAAGRAASSSCPLYMVPGDVVVRAELPRSPNGKFDRNLLRQELARMTRRPPSTARSARRRRAARRRRSRCDRLAERVGGTPFFAYDRALLDRADRAAARGAARPAST